MEIRAKNHDFFSSYGQYKSLLEQLYPQSMASSHYEGVDRPSPFPDSDIDVLGRMHLGIQSLSSALLKKHNHIIN